MIAPRDIQLIGRQLAVLWEDGRESFYSDAFLRAASPSAEARGEPDVLGRISGGEARRDFSDVEVAGWEKVGNYAIRFTFSDGHRTGLYTYDYLRQIDPEPPSDSTP